MPVLHFSAQDLSWSRLRESQAAGCDRGLRTKTMFCTVPRLENIQTILISYSDGLDVNYFFNLWKSFLPTWKPNLPESWRLIGGAKALGWISFNYLKFEGFISTYLCRPIFRLVDLRLYNFSEIWLENAIRYEDQVYQGQPLQPQLWKQLGIVPHL